MCAYIMFAGTMGFHFTPAVRRCENEIRISHEAADTTCERLFDGNEWTEIFIAVNDV